MDDMQQETDDHMPIRGAGPAVRRIAFKAFNMILTKLAAENRGRINSATTYYHPPGDALLAASFEMLDGSSMMITVRDHAGHVCITRSVEPPEVAEAPQPQDAIN